MSYEEFLEAHEPQLLTSAVPEHFWKPLYEKLKESTLDAGEFFQIVVEQNEEDELINYSVTTVKDISASDPNSVFLVDHAWTFRLNTARQALTDVKGLKERMMAAFGIRVEDLKDEAVSDYVGSESGDAKPKTPRTSESHDDANMEENKDDKDSDISSTSSSIAELDGRIINAIMDNLPKFMNTYTIKIRKNVVDETDMPLWFITDDFGIRIGHSEAPNFRMIPFFYAFENIAYSILFPIKDVASGETVTRNYVAHSLLNTHPDWYPVLMHPWQEIDLADGPIKFSHKDDSFFMDGRIPDQIQSLKTSPVNELGALDTVKIFASDDQLIKHLRGVTYELVEDIYKADVIWTREHFHDFTSLAERNPHALVNQFPYESSLTVKDLFAACVQSCDEFTSSFDDTALEWKWPTFYPATFNLNEELPAFLCYYQKRKQRNLDNAFIVKPWNLARGLDTYVTKNADYVIRLAETGPKLACKYVDNPVLFRRPDTGRLVKFDLRYIVFVRSVSPLNIHVYKDFWPRCAINNYDSQNLDDILAHLSVFNYSEKDQVLNIRSQEFIEHLHKLHPQIDWPAVQQKIDNVIKATLEIATRNKPPRGIAPNPQSRAMYGFDVMLKWQDDGTPYTLQSNNNQQKEVEVVFLEANFMPDCERACEFYEDFADTVFQTLFLGGGGSDKTRQIC